MKRLSPVSHGAAAGLPAQAKDTCVIPAATYRSDFWESEIKKPAVRKPTFLPQYPTILSNKNHLFLLLIVIPHHPFCHYLLFLIIRYSL